MASKRANGEGTIYFDQKYQVWRCMLTTPAGKRMSKQNKDKAVVVDWYNEQKLLIGRKEHIEPNNLNLGAWFAEWLETYARFKVKPRTYDRYKGMMQYFEPLFNEKLTNIKAIQLQKLYNSMLTNNMKLKKKKDWQDKEKPEYEPYSPQTVIHANNCISGCFKQAILNGLIRENPASKVQRPKVIKTEIEIYAPEELKRMFDAAPNYRNSLIIPLVYVSGLRLSEILALRCEDINSKAGTLTVSQTIHVSKSNGIYFSDTKSTTSSRTIPIPQSIIKQIEEHKVKTGIRTGLLFLNTLKKPETQTSYLNKVYCKIQKEANVYKGFHTFRHTHASELLNAGIPIHDVSRRLGHSKVSVTLNTYAHFVPASNENMVNAVEMLLKNIK